MTPRRALTGAVLLCLAGAGLALWAATRVWTVEVTDRPVPLPDLRSPRTGGDLHSWLPALAVVALAGAGAIISTRGVVRRLVGVLLLALGAAVAVGGVLGVRDGVWPVLTLLGGVAVMVAGGWTGVAGAGWPGLGARYEAPVGVSGAAAVVPAVNGPRDNRQTWDALDRGEDPTDD